MRNPTHSVLLQTETRIDETFTNAVQQQVKTLLRGDIAAIVLGVILTVIGLSAITIHLFRARTKNRLLLWFGLFTGLYGLRLLASTQTINLLVDVTPLFWRYLRSGITSVILIPSLLYMQGLYGRGWKSSVRWLIWIQTIYGAGAILVNLIGHDPTKAPDPIFVLFFPLLSVVPPRCALSVRQLSKLRARAGRRKTSARSSPASSRIWSYSMSIPSPISITQLGSPLCA